MKKYLGIILSVLLLAGSAQAATFSLPADCTAVAGTVISSTKFNACMIALQGAINSTAPILPQTTYSALPSAGTPGRLYEVTDDIRGIWKDTGTLWYQLEGAANVKEFGAKGDGVTDDTTAIQAAINAHTTGTGNGGIVDLPKGRYLISATLVTAGRYVWLRGAGRGETILEMTTTATSRHAISATGATGWLRVTDMTIKTTTDLSADYAMKAVSMDIGVAPTLPANSVLEVERINISGFNFGVYADGGDSAVIIRVSVTDSIISTSSVAQPANIVSDAVNFNRVQWGIVERNILDSTDTGDHSIYCIGSQHLRIKNNEMKNTWSQAVKLITDGVLPGHPLPISWVVEDNYIHDVQEALLVDIEGSYTLPLFKFTGNTIDTDASSTDGYAALIIANTPGAIDHADMHGNSWKNLDGGAVVFQGTGTISSVNLLDSYVYNWSTESSGTYSAFSDSSGGTKGTVQFGGYFNGNSTGRSASLFSVFSRIQAGDVTETGTTLNSEHRFRLPIGNTASRYRPSGVLYVNATTAGSPADANENTLMSKALDASTLSVNTRGIRVRAWGRTLNNGDAKTIKLKFGTSVLATNDVTGSPNNLQWVAEATILRVASNTQNVLGTMTVAAVPQTTKAVASISTTDSAAITIALTAQTAGTLNDVYCDGMVVEYLPEP